MPAIKIDAPEFFSTEEALRIRLSGSQPPNNMAAHDVAVVSGYAHWDDATINGDSSSDYTAVSYEVHMDVGPQWRQIFDVSPTVTIAGFSHWSSDEADATGYGVSGCTWQEPNGPPPLKIHLIVQLHTRGGPDSHVRKLAYHLVARGLLMAAGPNWDPDAYFKENLV